MQVDLYETREQYDVLNDSAN